MLQTCSSFLPTFSGRPVNLDGLATLAIFLDFLRSLVVEQFKDFPSDIYIGLSRLSGLFEQFKELVHWNTNRV